MKLFRYVCAFCAQSEVSRPTYTGGFYYDISCSCLGCGNNKYEFIPEPVKSLPRKLTMRERITGYIES